MDCTRVDQELIGFHLAALDGATRASVETHLTGCARCVSGYLALKRAIDASEEGPAPSEMTRARIRAAAVQLATPARKPVQARPRRATWALAATAAAAMLVAPLLYRTLRTTSEGPVTHVTEQQQDVPVATQPAGETVDTARVTPVNLAFL